MAIRNTSLGGTNWANGEVLYAVTDLNDTFDAAAALGLDAAALSPWKSLSAPFSPGTAAARAFVAFSSTNWAVYHSGSSVRYTTNGGSTWNTATGGTANINSMRRARGSSTHAIAVQMGGTAISFTSDAGVNWTAGTIAAGYTSIQAFSVATSTRAVLAGIPSSGQAISYSTNNGSTWTKSSTGPTAQTTAIDMWDANTGFAIDTSGNIWKTTDGGVNWTDTTYNMVENPSSDGAENDMLCLSDNSFVFVLRDNGIVQLFTGAATPTVVTQYRIGSSTAGQLARFVETTNGYIYFGIWGSSTVGGFTGALLRSKDNGLTWQMMNISFEASFASPTIMDFAGNVLYLLSIGQSYAPIITIDESRE